MDLESRRLMFAQKRDISMKLNDTYVLYKGKFRYCAVSESSHKLHLYEGSPQQSPQKIITEVLDPEVSFVFPKLGYFNFNGDARYVSKATSRTTKIGLCTRSLAEYAYNGTPVRMGAFSSLTWVEMNQMFLDEEYYKVPHAIARVTGGKNKSIAINRTSCIFKDEMDMIKFGYKNTIIGWISKKKDEPTLVIPESKSNQKAVYEKCIGLPVKVVEHV